MSLSGSSVEMTTFSFPRVSGDEPAGLESGHHLRWFSPRERG